MNKLTVAIVTKDRAEQLRTCLGSLIPQAKFIKELLIIDNASSDSTRRVAESFKAKLPLKYVYEEKIGIPDARNRALKEARGRIIAFIDDDCIAGENWVNEMIKAHKDNPNVAAVMGYSQFIPDSVFSRVTHKGYDSWIRNNTDSRRNIYILDTKNISLKKNLCEGVFFDTTFTRGSDVDFGEQLLKRRKRIKFHRDAVVYAGVRANLKGFLAKNYAVGISQARHEFKWGRNSERVYRGRRASLFLDKKYDNSFPFRTISYLAKKFKTYGIYYGMMCILLDYKRLEFMPKLDKRKLSSSKKKIRISVMIITKDRYESLEKCLISLTRQTKLPDQVVIVDSSGNKKPEVVKPFMKRLPIKYIPEERAGFGIQRNIALDHSHGDVGAIIDDDAEAHPTWVSELLRAHQEYPQVLAIQGRIISKSKSKLIESIEQMSRDVWILGNLTYEGKLNVMTGNNSSYKLDEIRKLNLRFAQDSLHNKHNGEDVDMANQILISGKSILFVPSIKVDHWERDGLRSILKQRFRIGCSMVLIGKDWNNSGINKNLFSVRVPNSIILMQKYLLNWLFHPSFKLNLISFVLIPAAILLRDIALRNGLGYIKRIVKGKIYPPKYLVFRDARFAYRGLSVVITSSGPKNLENCMISLAKQVIYPYEVIMLDDDISGESKKTAIAYNDILPIKYFRTSGKINSRINAIKQVSGKIVCFIDGNCIASPDWTFKFIEAHKKYPRAALIQGWTERYPRGSMISVLKDFFNTNLINNTLSEEPEFKVRSLDLSNISMKISSIKKLNYNIDSGVKKTEAVIFTERIISKKQIIKFYPQAFAFIIAKGNVARIIKDAFIDGVEMEDYSAKWDKSNKLHVNYYGSIKAFTSFSIFLKKLDRVFFTIVLIMYQQVFNGGRIYQKVKSRLYFS